MNSHVPVETDSLIGTERAVRAGVIASASSYLWCRWTVVQLQWKSKFNVNSILLEMCMNFQIYMNMNSRIVLLSKENVNMEELRESDRMTL